MFDYYATIRKADSIYSQANILRRQAKNVERLRSVVGNQYAGKDAQEYGNAVNKAKDELISIAIELEKLATRIRSTAKEINSEEATRLAEKEASSR